MPIDTEGVAECIDCGRCCFSRNAEYLRVAGYDYDRLGDKAEAVTHFVENRAYMKMSQDGHCAQLTYEPKQKLFLCAIYEDRPDVCRVLERGSGQCRAESHEKKERPLIMLRRAHDAEGLSR